MKKINRLYPTIIAFCAIALAGCQAEDDTASISGEETILSIAPSVADMKEESVTRAATNNFFKTGDEITVTITTSRSDDASTDYTYKYNQDNAFTSTSPFRFKLDNTYIKDLVAHWPKKEIREGGIVLDQRELEAYQQADRLEAKSENINIMPTAEPVPLIFEHEQSRFSFRMAGQNANGLNILSVILELQYDNDGDPNTGNVSGAFWAYCDNTETASLILVPGTEIKADIYGGGDRYMIGRAEVGNTTTQYTGGIWLDKSISVTLAAGTDYVVTLTPEGYNLIASIEIHGFGQSEGYVGIPIQMPTENTTTNKYEIGNANQLVTLSRLLQGKIDGENTETWKGHTYTIKSSVVMTENAKLYYLPMEDSMKDKIENENGEKIETINEFNLFQ